MSPPPPSTTPFNGVHQSRLLACLYTSLSLFSTAAVGAGLLFYWSDTLSGDSQLVSGTVKTFCLVTGVMLLASVAVWCCFSFLIWQTSKTFLRDIIVSSNAKSLEAQRSRTSHPSLPSTCCISLLGMLSLLLLLLSVVLELSLTGLLWWNSRQLGLQFQVRGDCFCLVGQFSAKVEDVLQLGCLQTDSLSCPAVYQAVPVQLSGGLLVSTRQCQLLDGSGLDPDCLQYRAFWDWFKGWRIVLPLVVMVKLPLLIFCCCSWISWVGRKEVPQEQRHGPVGAGQYDNFATSSISFANNLVNPPSSSSVDPVKFYGNMCAPVDVKHAHEKLEIEEQIQVQEMCALASKPATLRSTAAMARSIANSYAPAPSSPPPLTAVACPVAPPTIDEDSQAGLSQDDSPPDIQEHTISTPIQSDQLPKTPQFDLSKVVKPVYEEDFPATYTSHQVEQSKLPRQSSFSSSIFRLQNNQHKAVNDFDLQKFPQDLHRDKNHYTGFIPPPPPPPLRKSSNSAGYVSAVPLSLVPPPKPKRSCSISSTNNAGPVSSVPTSLIPPPKPVRSTSISSTTPSHVKVRNGSASAAPLSQDSPPAPVRHSSNSRPMVDHPATPVQVIVENASDYDSSTCGSTHSTTQILSSTRYDRKTCKVWPTSPAPARLQLSGTSAAGCSGVFLSDIQEISRRARNISNSSNVDWSKLP